MQGGLVVLDDLPKPRCHVGGLQWEAFGGKAEVRHLGVVGISKELSSAILDPKVHQLVDGRVNDGGDLPLNAPVRVFVVGVHQVVGKRPIFLGHPFDKVALAYTKGVWAVRVGAVGIPWGLEGKHEALSLGSCNARNGMSGCKYVYENACKHVYMHGLFPYVC